jgi:hypothetical protein
MQDIIKFCDGQLSNISYKLAIEKKPEEVINLLGEQRGYLKVLEYIYSKGK